MKYLLTIVLAILTTVGFAQSEYNNKNYYYSTAAKDIVYLVPGVKNKTVIVESKNIRSGKTYRYQKTFNELGLMTEQRDLRKGRNLLDRKMEYNADGKLLNQKRYRKGDLLWEYQIERDEEGRKIVYQSLKGNKLKTKSVWAYKENAKCLDNSVLYKKDGTTVKKKWNYEYYSECDKKQSTLTNGKGKVLKTWTYDCKKEGEELTKKKDVKQICTWEETDDSHLIKVQQTFDERGRVVKMVAKYRSSDTSLVSYKRYNSDNELTYESESDPDLKKELFFKSYRKGKLRYMRTYEYDGKNLVNYSWYKNDKMRYSTKYEYNNDNELIVMKSFIKGGKESRSTLLSYQ